MFDAPEPVFKKVDRGKKPPKLYRRFGPVTVYRANGQVTVLREGGYERAYPKTFPRKKGEESDG